MSRQLQVTLVVNGHHETLRVDPFETLLTTLRDRLQLTAAKRGCNQGVCGACLIMIAKRPVRACLTLTANCVDEAILTVEALSTPFDLSSLQTALAEAGGIQCGFCTPGMIMALTALLDQNPHPSRDEVREAISGNLCRCTGYQKIIDAVMGLSERTPT